MSPGDTSSPLDFQALFEASPNAYVLLDTDFTIVEANKTYLETVDRGRDEILGRSIFDAFPGDPVRSEDPNVRRLRASFERVLSSGERDSLALIPYVIPQKTGEGTEYKERYWSTTHTPILGENGNVEYILQHTTDVTELYEEGFYEEDLPKEDLAEEGASVENSAREDLQEEEGAEEDVTEETARREEAEKSQKEGATSQQIQEGVFSRAEAVQRAYWAREEERDRLRRLFKQAPGFMVFQRGPNHVYELANDAYLDLIDRQDIIGKSAREVLPELEGQGFFELLDRVYESGEPYVGREVEARVQKESGEGVKTVYVDFIYQPVTSSDGEVIGIFTQGHDVSEKKRTKERLRKRKDQLKTLNETLEERVEKRTRQVRDLTSKVTMAEQRERERIARVLHDGVQQKLYGIQLKMSSVGERPLGENSLGERSQREGASGETSSRDRERLEGGELLEGASRSEEPSQGASRREKKLLEKVEEMEGRLEEAIQSIRQLSVGMSPPVLGSEGLTAALEWLQSHMEETRELSVELTAEGEFRVEEEMRVLLFQAVRELLKNVDEHANVGQASVHLREEKGTLVIEVTDEGQGFDPETLENFGPEEGFGLTAARERIRLFGGDLKIQSVPKEGTTVTIQVPMHSGSLNMDV